MYRSFVPECVPLCDGLESRTGKLKKNNFGFKDAIVCCAFGPVLSCLTDITLPNTQALFLSLLLTKTKMHFTTTLRWLAVTSIALSGTASVAAATDAATADKLLSARAADANQLAAASRIVDDAIAKMTILNKARLDHPMRNQYRSKSATGSKRRRSNGDADSPPPLLEITPDIAAAAALVAEADRAAELPANNGANAPVQGRAEDIRVSPYWMENLSRKGSVPWGNDPNYKVGWSLCFLLCLVPSHSPSMNTARSDRFPFPSRCSAILWTTEPIRPAAT